MSVVVYLAYGVLAVAEILVLFASAIALLVLAVKQAVKAINSLVDMVMDAASPGAEPRGKRMSFFKVEAGNRLRRIPGGHNEYF